METAGATGGGGGPGRRIRVLLVDDQDMVRKGLRMRLELEPDLEVVGEAGGGEEVPSAVARCAPDVVLMDVAMPVVDGIAATAGLAAARAVVVVLSLYDDAQTRARAAAAGAVGFVGKHRAEDELIGAIRRAARRGSVRGSRA